MKSQQTNVSPSAEVDKVVFDYLDEMLHDSAAEEERHQALSKLLARSALLRKEFDVSETPTDKFEPDISSPPQVVETHIPETDITQETTPGTTPETTRPSWSEQPFECLIFNVAGLKLAVPLVCLGSIFAIDRKFNELPGQQDWLLGILKTPNAGNIMVMDTAKFIMPESYQPAMRDNLKYVISLFGFSWGLACHSVERSITLQPDQIKWRSARGKRPWLAGTVIAQMCSLIDTEGFQQIIDQSE